jgi:hypothetical protein
MPPDKNLSIQSWLCPALTPVPANLDYDCFKEIIENIDKVILTTCIESLAANYALANEKDLNEKQQASKAEFGIYALRVNVLRDLLGHISFRELSRQISRSDLLASFCGVLRLDGICWASKSTLGRASKLFTKEQLKHLHQTVLDSCSNKQRCCNIGLEEPIDASICLVDGTCLETNIHFPTDWILLKDVAVTLLKATKLIRTADLLCRMPNEPKHFAKEMNRLCIEMTHSRRRKGGKKMRKGVLRKMKRLLKRIGEHAYKHCQRLKDQWDQTNYSKAQAEQIIQRIETKLVQLPQVIKQAHERIIGERQVASKDKILSVHETDTQVIVRGKAGKEVEFGNTLFLAESVQGYILDWKLYQGQAPAETQQLLQSLQRQNQYNLQSPIVEVVSDRGFASKQISELLNKENIFDATCPRQPQKLSEKMQNKRFSASQKRRGATEARIATIKNIWLAKRVRARGFAHRNLAVGWAVIGHNLWLIAKMIAQAEKQRQKQAA